MEQPPAQLTASVHGKHLSISKKHAVEICRFIKGKSIKQSKKLLEEVIAFKRAVPFTTFNRDVGHKVGMAAGRYPINASEEVLRLLKSLESNAQNKGMNLETLYVKNGIANKAPTPFHPGRQRGTKMKRTHLQLIAQEKQKGEQKKEKK